MWRRRATWSRTRCGPGGVRRPESYPWSSARAHLGGVDDDLVTVAPLLQRVPDWRSLLQSGLPEPDLDALRRHQHTGRPLGGQRFIETLEQRLGRVLKKRKPAPKPDEKSGS